MAQGPKKSEVCCPKIGFADTLEQCKCYPEREEVPMNYSCLCGVIWAAIIAAATVGQSSSFHGLGDLPGGDINSEAFDVSADGSVVVGRSDAIPIVANLNSMPEAFRWTAHSGLVGLGFFSNPSPPEGVALGVSDDGSVITGVTGFNGTNTAFRWTADSGLVPLSGLPPGLQMIRAYGISGDGETIVGLMQRRVDGEEGICTVAELSDGRCMSSAFRWTSESGVVGLDTTDLATAVSQDGSVIVGLGLQAGVTQAFRWTADRGVVPLGDLAGGGFFSKAHAVSRDGSVVVGEAFSSNGIEAFRWTADGGMIGLGDLPGGLFQSTALGVSGDGSVVVGTSAIQSGEVGAFIWDAVNGMRHLQSVLATEYEVDLSGWSLQSAEAISDDGRTIVGFGRHAIGQSLYREAWIVRLDSP